jgi:hypothetical protein
MLGDFCRTGILAISFAIALTQNQRTSGAEFPKDSQEMRVPGCAETSVFSLLHALGKETTFEDIASQFESLDSNYDKRVVSIASLRTVLARYGVSTVAKRCNPKDIRSIPTPCILYFAPGKWRPAERPDVGHFVTLVGWKDERAVLLEWSTQHTMPVVSSLGDDLQSAWDGEAILHDRATIWESWMITVVLILSGCCLAYSWMPRRRSQLAVVLAVMALLSGNGCGDSQPAQPSFPTLLLTKAVENRKTVLRDEPIEVIFRFRTWDHSNVRVLSITKDCSCTTIDSDWLGKELPPNSEHSFKVRIRPEGMGGESFVRRLELLTDPPSPAPVVAVVAYRIRESPMLSTDRVALTIAPNTTPEANLQVTFHRALSTKPLKLDLSRSSATHFQLSPSPVNSDVNSFDNTVIDTLVVHLQGKAYTKPGRYEGLVSLAFLDGTKQSIPSIIEVPHPYSPRLRHLYLGKLTPGQTWQRSIQVDRAEGWSNVPTAAVNGHPLSARISDDPAIQLEGTTPISSGKFESVIDLQFPSNLAPDVRIRVWGLVAD